MVKGFKVDIFPMIVEITQMDNLLYTILFAIWKEDIRIKLSDVIKKYV
jgi:hypothetical protein